MQKWRHIVIRRILSYKTDHRPCLAASICSTASSCSSRLDPVRALFRRFFPGPVFLAFLSSPTEDDSSSLLLSSVPPPPPFESSELLSLPPTPEWSSLSLSSSSSSLLSSPLSELEPSVGAAPTSSLSLSRRLKCFSRMRSLSRALSSPASRNGNQ